MSKYYIHSDLSFKQIKLSFKQKLIRVFLFFLITISSSTVYISLYNHIIQKTKKQEILEERLEELKVNYMLLNRSLDDKMNMLKSLEQSDEVYRGIIEIEPCEYTPFVSNDLKSFEDYSYPDIIIFTYRKLDSIRYLTDKEEYAFYELEKETKNWISKLAHLPYITPVNTSIRRGEGIKFREVHPILGRPAWHHGQDFSAPMGTPVYATGAGKVIYVGVDRGLGNFIRIDHGYGYQTIYGHLSEFKVKYNQEVKRGDTIALSGSTGYSTGPHLHYEIHLYGRYQNPLNFFEDDLIEEEYLAMIITLNELFN